MSALQILSCNIISPGVWRRNKFKRETHRKLQVPFSLSLALEKIKMEAEILY